MTRLFRWLLYFVFFLVTILAVAYGVATAYKPKILATINEELQQIFQGEIHIGGLDFTVLDQFPKFSITLSEVYMRGPRYNQYRKDFFSAEKIFVHVKPWNILRGQISLGSITIRNAEGFIFRASDGYTNTEVLKKKEKTEPAPAAGKPAVSLSIEKLLLENTHFLYFDSVKRKSYGARFVKTTIALNAIDSARIISIDGKMAFDGLMLNEEKGSYLLNKQTDARLRIKFFPDSKFLEIDSSALVFQKSHIALLGHFDFKPGGEFTLHITSPDLDFDEALTIVPQNLSEKLRKFSFSKPIKLQVDIAGALAGAQPKVDVIFASKDNRVAMKKIAVERTTFSGTFTNHLNETGTYDDANSRVLLETFNGELRKMPIAANFSVVDLGNPLLTIVSKSQFPLTKLNELTDSATLRFTAGDFYTAVSYQGELNEYLDSTRTSYKGKLKGLITLTGGTWEMPSMQKKFNAADINIQFDEKVMDLNKINFRVNDNPVEIKGKVTGFVPFFFQPEQKGNVNLSIHSSRLDLASLTKKKVKARKKNKMQGKRISETIDALYEKVEFSIDLKVDELVKGSLKASDVSGKVTMAKNELTAGPLTMKMADGNIRVITRMTQLHQPVNPVTLDAQVKDADIRKFFRSFDNFSQKTITADNLSGKVSITLNLSANVDEQFNLLSPTLRGAVDFKLRNGRLKDFEPLEKMSNFLFKKRDFSDVEFAEIRSHFKLSGKSFDVGRMEVESSVLTLFLEGRYSMTGDTDLSIQVPLSNLKKRDKDYKPQNVGTDAKVGPSVFIRATTKDGKLVLAYDPFKKFRKD